MNTKKDIETREDIALFIRAFYKEVLTDKTIGNIFTEVMPINWEHHIPLITDFWETILLDNPVYKNNAMEVHYKLHAVFPLHKKHFDAWLMLFNLVLNKMFTGPVTELAKKRATDIARLMEFKINQS